MLAVGIGAALAYQVAALTQPYLASRAVDDVLVRSDTAQLVPIVVAFLAVATVKAVSSGARKFAGSRTSIGLGSDLRQDIYEHVQRQSFSVHDRMGVGQLLTRMSSDISHIEVLAGSIPFLVQSLGLGVGGAVLTFMIDPLLSVAVVVLVAAASFAAVRRSQRLDGASRDLQERVGDFAGFVEQQVQGILVVKGHGSEPVSRRTSRSLADAVHEAGTEVALLRARFLATFLVGPSGGLVVVVALGGALGVRGRITPGELLAFLQYLGLLLAPVQVISQLLARLPNARAAAARIGEVLGSEPDVRTPGHGARRPDGPGAIRFESVRFGYRDDIPVLDGVDLEIPAGTSTALVGLAGSGKSTLALLVPRFYDPWAGAVLLDGVSVDRLVLPALRSKIAMVFEDTVVFSGTIRDNIAIGRPDAGEKAILDAARRAEVDRFVADLPDGYDTVVGENGVGLSGGQRQRLAIARALLRNPSVLILDDATSAVDPATDAALRASLSEMMRGRTSLVIAHRVETLALADRVVLLDGRRVVAAGSHQDLLDVPPYREALALPPPDDAAAATGRAS